MNAISTGIHGVGEQLLLNYQRNSEKLQTSVERLSTGKRINRPSDDPSGFIAAEGFRRELADLKLKLGDIATNRQQNHQQQSGLANIQETLNDLRSHLAEVPSEFITADERATIQDEINQAADAIDRIAKLTDLPNAPSLRLDKGVNIEANEATSSRVDQQAQDVAQRRAALGAEERTQLDTFEALYQDQVAITSEALSQTEDTDFAAETSNLVQSQILSQASIAALSYANQQHVSQVAVLLDSVA